MKESKQQTQSHSSKIVEVKIKPNNLGYAREKLGVAVWKLATGIEGIKARLADAFIELVIIQESDLPPEFREMWKQIRSDLSSGKMQYDTVVRDGELVKVPAGLLYSTLRYMRTEKAQRIAKQICELESMLNSYVEEKSNS